MSVLDSRPNDNGMSLRKHQQLSRTLSLDGDATAAAAASLNFAPLEAMVFKRSNSVSAISSAGTRALPARHPNFKIELPPKRPLGPIVDASGNVIASKITTPSNAFFSLCPGPLTPPDDAPSFEVTISSAGESQSGTPSAAAAGKPVEDPLNVVSHSVNTPSQPSSSNNQAPDRTPNMNTEKPNTTLAPLEEAISSAISMIDVFKAPSNSTQVVAQVLPNPLNEPEIEAPTAFDTLVRTLKSISPGYVHVHHVVPTTMALSSPLITPSAASGQNQEDYFDMSRIISSVTYLASPYQIQLPGTPSSPQPAPGTPTLAIPPSCAEVSLYERFIPPGSDREFLDLFDTAAPSALVDRLTELGPSGTLLFIYPTKAGAETFLRTYLNPLLDPVLRTIILNRALSSHIGPEIARMAAVPHLLPFERLARRLRTLLWKLNQGGARGPAAASTAAHASTTTGSPGAYALVHASAARAPLPRRAWERWWIQQETPRVKAATAAYFRVGKSLPEDQRISSTALAREIVEALAKRGYAPGEATGEGEGVEVGVFAIKRQS